MHARSMPSLRAAALVGVLVAAAAPAMAEMTTFQFEGRVCDATRRPDGHRWFPRGTPVTGTFTYDTAGAPYQVNDWGDSGMEAYYRNGYAPDTMTMRILDHTAMSKRGWARVLDGPQDVFSVTGSYPTFYDGRRVKNGSMGLVLWSMDGTGVTGIGLPTTFDMSRFALPCNMTYGYLQTDGGADDGRVFFVIDSITATPPATTAPR